MVRIEPFKGLRPGKDIAHQVASPPYDVLSSKEAKVLTADNKLSFLRIIKPEVDLPDGIDPYSDEVYQKAKENFAAFIRDKILVRDKTKNFYIYKQVWRGHTQVGLVAGASCQDYQDDVIKKHEFTREEKEIDRMRHIKTLNANTGPVFLTFKQRHEIDALFEKAMQQDPEYDFESDEVRHIFYVVDHRDQVAAIKQAFAKVDYLYVADGHHRSASGTRVKIERQKQNPHHTGDEEYNFFLSVIFPHHRMKILPYNRVVKDICGMCKAEFFHKLSAKFDYEEADLKEPQRSGEYCLYIDGKWYLLKAKPGSYDKDDAVASLDAAILQNNLLDPVLGIKNPRKDKRIDFVGGIRGTAELEKLVDSGEYKVAFSLFPTTIEQLFKVADAGKVMPPKSTWFEPKLKSGLVIHLLDD
ncbi:MAG: DUF1015 domain-containing protein [Candidatus Aminicenantes bacterium]|nr:MAG: DUF1015 domain-containing protein [Candidatus Aminicenantes bacterium]